MEINKVIFVLEAQHCVCKLWCGGENLSTFKLETRWRLVASLRLQHLPSNGKALYVVFL